MANTADFDIKDISLAAQGQQRMEWALHEMPVLRALAQRFEKSRPLQGLRVSGCLHITTETANLARALNNMPAPGFTKFYIARRYGGIVTNNQSAKVAKVALS